MLQGECGIHVQVCRNNDMKCAVVERVHRTISHIKLRTDISMFCQNLSRPAVTRFTRPLAWRPSESPI